MPFNSTFNRARFALACFSIAANTLLAGGVFTFPLISPTLSTHLKFTQIQVSTIALAGVLGQYPFAAFVGKANDVYGPRLSSFVACILFSVGFGVSAWEIGKPPTDATLPSSGSFPILVVCFFLAGLGAVFSFFSSMFAASKLFPNHLGFASGTSMAFYGLSPLFLSVFASTFFTDPEAGLNVVRYLRGIVLFAGSVHLLGTFTLSLPETSVDSYTSQNDETDPIEEVHEGSALLPPKPGGLEGASDRDASALQLLSNPHFWILVTVLVLVLGACEMVMSNIGTIVLALPSTSTAPAQSPWNDAAASTQVKIISTSNTVTRLIVGPLADLLSSSTSGRAPRRISVSRITFLSGASLLLSAAFLWTEIGVRSRESMWTLSVSTGIAYGTTFTILPSIMSAIWGSTNLGRNFGIATYSPFIGTPIFSYLYAFDSAHHSKGQGICEGVSCWQLTFMVCFITTSLAFFASIYLSRLWKGRV